jgi:hypothetical protein
LPNKSNVVRGTLILLAPDAIDDAVSAKNIYLNFQYNPDHLIHTFNPTTTPAGNSGTRYLDAEFFTLGFELDSLEMEIKAQNQVSQDLGLHPELALMELMTQPQGESRTSLPIVIFKWGEKRVVPVYIVTMTIEEKAFNLMLNPTRATISLTLKVIDAAEAASNKGAAKAFIRHQNDRVSLVKIYKSETGQTLASPRPGITA